MPSTPAPGSCDALTAMNQGPGIHALQAGRHTMRMGARQRVPAVHAELHTEPSFPSVSPRSCAQQRDTSARLQLSPTGGTATAAKAATAGVAHESQWYHNSYIKISYVYQGACGATQTVGPAHVQCSSSEVVWIDVCELVWTDVCDIAVLHNIHTWTCQDKL